MDYPDELESQDSLIRGEFFPQTDFPDILPGRIFLTYQVREMRLGNKSRDVMSLATISMAPNMQHQMIGNY